jgi:2-keto-3-deoxy-L-rhamnonate aldolase RhmA
MCILDSVHAVEQFVVALRYKPEGRRLDSLI